MSGNCEGVTAATVAVGASAAAVGATSVVLLPGLMCIVRGVAWRVCCKVGCKRARQALANLQSPLV